MKKNEPKEVFLQNNLIFLQLGEEGHYSKTSKMTPGHNSTSKMTVGHYSTGVIILRYRRYIGTNEAATIYYFVSYTVKKDIVLMKLHEKTLRFHLHEKPANTF